MSKFSGKVDEWSSFNDPYKKEIDNNAKMVVVERLCIKKRTNLVKKRNLLNELCKLKLNELMHLIPFIRTSSHNFNRLVNRKFLVFINNSLCRRCLCLIFKSGPVSVFRTNTFSSFVIIFCLLVRKEKSFRATCRNQGTIFHKHSLNILYMLTTAIKGKSMP